MKNINAIKLFFETINNFNKPITRLIFKRESKNNNINSKRGTSLQILWILNEETIVPNSMLINYKTDEMNKSLERNKLAMFGYKVIEKLNSPIFILKNSFGGKFSQTFKKEIISIPCAFFWKIEEKRILTL